MSNNNSVSLLKNIESLFGSLFQRTDITEIVVNCENKVFYEDSSGFHEGTEEENARITQKACKQFSNALAAYSNQTFNENKPIMGATLPNGERVQVIMPPALDHQQFSITIRKPSGKTFDLSHYKDQGFFDDLVLGQGGSIVDQKLTEFLDQNDYSKFLDLAVSSAQKNIIIVGETGSGKTTFMKSLIDSISVEERLITIEDTREIFLKNHTNFVNLLYPQGAKAGDFLNATTLLKSCLRMRPDRILVSELRGGETFDYINAVSSGHGGSITSLHAGSVDEALMRLTLMFLQNDTGSRIPYETVSSIIKNTIDIILIIKINNGKRKLHTLYWKDYKNDKK